jgi:ssDNA-binding Zn-finger/Zn-ribbon topoisomerase 1
LSVTAACDNCDHVFKIKKLKTRIVRDDVIVFYFVCPNCKREYKSYYSNQAIEMQQKVVRKTRAAFINNPRLTIEQAKKMEKVFIQEKSKLERMMYDLAIEIEKV